ncbi:3-dehydroquinate synthase [Buchnera aphidicola]|uniref:3-dehydroquinate synthase n=1 Tax=Buchnera aphidicola TaxID=9 RepID=UPI0031B87D32
MTKKCIYVKTKDHEYPIFIGKNIFENKSNFDFFSSGNRLILVTNNTIEKCWKKKIINNILMYPVLLDEFILPDGESYKNLDSVNLLLSYLLKNNHNRNSILLALGGGVIGDLTGFVASIYQRGIKFIQVPTTLLSQVDAAIGGKTGVNHILGKNMIGTFYQPSAVFTDINFLFTLPKRQLISGFAEVIKYAISFNFNFFLWIEKNFVNLLSMNLNDLLYCIRTCCEIKSHIVHLDEREKGMRALLNLGHTYGHAIEAYFKYSYWLHGEAVSIGMVMACRTAELLGLISTTTVTRVINLLNQFGLPVYAPKNMLPEKYIQYMLRDKKNTTNGINLILPCDIGKTEIFKNIDQKIIISAIKLCYRS